LEDVREAVKKREAKEGVGFSPEMTCFTRNGYHLDVTRRRNGC